MPGKTYQRPATTGAEQTNQTVGGAGTGGATETNPHFAAFHPTAIIENGLNRFELGQQVAQGRHTFKLFGFDGSEHRGYCNLRSEWTSKGQRIRQFLVTDDTAQGTVQIYGDATAPGRGVVQLNNTHVEPFVVDGQMNPNRRVWNFQDAMVEFP